MAPTGFQALILCGPGESLNPFNSNPNDFPKALIPIANRPMVWYPLDWCYRTGVTNITLITPPSSAPALEAALSQNPHLTALPSPRPNVLAPQDLTLTTGTAEILRLSQTQDVINGDLIILPCDIVCEMNGIALLESWMTLQGSLSQDGEREERRGRRGGLGVWYQTKDSDIEGGMGVKREETDFLVTTGLPSSIVPPAPGSLEPMIEKAVITLPSSVLKDKLDEDKVFRLRRAALQEYGKLKMKLTLRDAHIYIFPYWIKDYAWRNDSFESIGEDLVGWWAKAGWQAGLPAKLGIDRSLGRSKRRPSRPDEIEPSVDLARLSSTSHEPAPPSSPPPGGRRQAQFASRVADAPTHVDETELRIPPLLAYSHPAQPAASLLRRVDTVPLLLSASLYIARLPSLTDAASTALPFAYEQKVHLSSSPSPELRLTLDRATVLVDANVTLTSKSTIRESVIGAGCVLGSPLSAVASDKGNVAEDAIRNAPPGVRLQKCLLMENVVVESGCVLSGCVLGRRCKIGKGSDLKDCFVQEGYTVPAGTVAKGEVLAGFDEGLGMEDGSDGFDENDVEGSA